MGTLFCGMELHGGTFFFKVLTLEKPVLHVQRGWKEEGEAIVTSVCSVAAVGCCL